MRFIISGDNPAEVPSCQRQNRRMPTIQIQGNIQGMRRAELLRRIEEILLRRRWSDRRACLAAGLTEDFIRNLRRRPEASVKVEKLTQLARALEVPAAYLIDDSIGPGDLMEASLFPALDPNRLLMAQRAAEAALVGAKLENFEEVRATLTAYVYGALTERARSGKPIEGHAADDFIDGLIRGMVARDMRTK